MSLVNLDDFLSPYPLEGENLKRFYVELEEGRGDNPKLYLEDILRNNPMGKQQLLFSGYRGCGKSTELNKLQELIADDFITVSYSVLQEFNPTNINYVELFIIVMEKLFKMAETEQIEIRASLLQSIKDWVDSEEIKKVQELAGKVETETGAEANLNVWFAKLFTKIRVQSNASSSTKKTITKIIEHRLSELIAHCNDLIREVKLKLPSINKKGLVLIIEDLDKLSVAQAEELFFNHSHTLTNLQTNVIFTFPISLQHHSKSNIIKGNFDQDYELPMVKIKTKTGEPYEKGRQQLYNILHKRIGKEYFENEALIDKFIDLSGGCLRDLFRLVRDAHAHARVRRKTDIIAEEDFKKAYFKLKRSYENTIAERRIDSENVITVEDYYAILEKVAKSTNKKTDNTEAALDLRQNLCILGYNDEGWCDVHPVVKDILAERE